jgi:hypothetical protein
MKFTKANYNPTDKKVGDCVVRAIMKATGQTWLTTYKELCAIGEQNYSMPNDKTTYEKYLEAKGWLKQKMPKQGIVGIRMMGGVKGSYQTYKRYTVVEFADENPKGTYIISVANHMTVLVNGELFDTWNCGNKSVGNYWIA